MPFLKLKGATNRLVILINLFQGHAIKDFYKLLKSLIIYCLHLDLISFTLSLFVAYMCSVYYVV